MIFFILENIYIYFNRINKIKNIIKWRFIRWRWWNKNEYNNEKEKNKYSKNENLKEIEEIIRGRKFKRKLLIDNNFIF